MILSGDAVTGNEALKIGLVDALAPQNRLIEEAKDFLKRHSQKRRVYQPRLKGLLNIFLDKTLLGQDVLKNQTKKFILKATHGHYPAPLKALEVVLKNYRSSLKSALKREAEAFSELVTGEVSKNLISIFYLVEKYKKEKWVEAKAQPVHKCGLIGAGVMGGGIAQLFS